MIFKTINKEQTGVIIEKKSKFIATIVPISSKNDAENNIKKIKKQYLDARHNCYAYCYLKDGSKITKSSDDGEPSGTAGIPILKVLLENNLCNVLVVVTRYFGGILLGTGGLMRAYTQSTQEAIKNSKIIQKQEGYEVIIQIKYQDLEYLKYYIKQTGDKIIDIQYGENIVMAIEGSINLIDQLKDKHCKIGNKIQKINSINKKYIEKNVDF